MLLPAGPPKNYCSALGPGLGILGSRQLQRCPAWWWRGARLRTEAPAALRDGMIRPECRVGATLSVQFTPQNDGFLWGNTHPWCLSRTLWKFHKAIDEISRMILWVASCTGGNTTVFSCILWIPLSVACCFIQKRARPPNDLPVGNNALGSLVTTVCLQG